MYLLEGYRGPKNFTAYLAMVKVLREVWVEFIPLGSQGTESPRGYIAICFLLIFFIDVNIHDFS